MRKLSSGVQPLLTEDALATATAGPLFATAVLLLLDAVGPVPIAALSDRANAGPAPWLTAVDSDCEIAGPSLLMARALSEAVAIPPGPACIALEEDRAAAGPAPVMAEAEPSALAATLEMAAAMFSAELGPKRALLSASDLAEAGPPWACADASERVLLPGNGPPCSRWRPLGSGCSSGRAACAPVSSRHAAKKTTNLLAAMS